MKAACGPHSNSHRRHGYTTNHATSWSESKSVSTSPKMVMPPFLRLDSTGEVSDDKLIGTPSSQGQQQKASAGGSKFPPNVEFGQHHASFTAHHLTSPQTQGRISALDDLINSSQVFKSVAKPVMRSPVKMAHHSHSTYQRSNPSNRYGQWGGVIGQHYPYFPPGVFPCHMFSPLYIPSTSGQSVHKAAWVTGVNLMNTCEQFAAQHYPAVPSVQPVDYRILCNRSASSSPQRDSKSNSCPSPVVSGHSVTGCVVDGEKANTKTEPTMKPLLCLPTRVQHEVEGRPKPTFAEDCSVYSMSSRVPKQRVGDIKPMDSITPTCAVESTCATVPTSCSTEEPTTCSTSTLAEFLPSIHDKRENDEFSCTAVTTKPQLNQSVASSDVSMIKGAENQSENQDSHSNKLSQFSDLVNDDLEVDWDDDDDDECDAVDEASESEAWNSFQFGWLDENSLLCKPKREEVEEAEYGVQQVKSPPKPNHAANQRWNLHHPAPVPSDRKSKVQFSCGEDVDQVHLFERDTMTMMEIQKLRDISRANEGQAGQILRRKRLECTSDEDDTSASDCAASPQKSDIVRCAVLCNGTACDSQKKSPAKAGKGVREEDCVDGGKAHADDDSDDEEDYLLFAVIGCAASTESESERDDDDDELEEEEEDDGFVITFE